MDNIFEELEGEILDREDILFDESKIKEFIIGKITTIINQRPESERPFLFQNIVYSFLEYMKISIIETPKTRDSGLDGIIKLNLQMLGPISLGLQIKYKKIDSTDIDSFRTALKNAELQLGTLICKDSTKLENYELNNKIKTILLARGIRLKEKLINDKINLNPILVLKFDAALDMVASELRAIARGIYKI